MEDNKRLFFIPIIAGAFNRGADEIILKDAFAEIQHLSRFRAYRSGFKQFKEFNKNTNNMFMEIFKDNVEILKSVVHCLIYELASGEFQGSGEQIKLLVSALNNHPTWKAELERLNKMLRDLQGTQTDIAVEILKEDKIIGCFPVSKQSTIFSSIRPGKYFVRFSTGRMIWQGELTLEDLLFAYAYPERRIPLAAETRPFKNEPTKVESFFDGELKMNVFPGFESGEVEFSVKRK